VFYPEGLAKSKWLEYYAEFLDSVELNVSFYRLPSEKTFKAWYRRTPNNFSFAVKGSRFITHIKKLNNIEAPLKLFLDRIKFLEEKLATVLWQLPPMFNLRADRLSDFVLLLNRLNIISHAFEFRNKSWLCDEVYHILKDNNMAICIADWPEFTRNVPVTADFVYLRRHKAGKYLYGGCYSDAALRADAKEIKLWLKGGRDVFIYFNNDEAGYAVKNAITLSKMVQGIKSRGCFKKVNFFDKGG
jgi:uncharacterized protein YecE (DUF72 family)